MLATILDVIAALGTITAGVYSLLWPLRVRAFTGLEAPGPRSITEIRAVLGGSFVELGLSAIVLGSAAYILLALYRSDGQWQRAFHGHRMGR